MKTNRLLRIVNKCTVIVFLLIASNCIAQTYPVQTNISSSGPYLNYLSYYGDDNNHLQLTVTQLDFNEPPILARLRIRIEGPGYELYTNPNATVGQPFLLDAGMPLTITGIDLLPYLQQGNLINPSGVDLNNLPHGFTTVCVDVIRESASQQVLSTNNCGFLPIQEYQPPQTFIPACDSVLDTNQMFHTFTWTPPVPFPAGAGIELLYDFSIYQWADPNNNSALNGNSILIYQQNDLIAPTTQVSDFDVQFELGRTYVWKVTARVESNGMPISLIENGGVSAPCTFIYGEAPTLNDVLADGLEIQLFTSPSSERKGKAWWTVTDNTPNAGLSTFDAYFVEYRKQPTGNEGFEIPWFSKTLSSLEYFIYQLEPSTAYEVKVSGVIAGTIGDPTPVETFTTPDPRIYNCGESDVPFLPTNYTPLENATAGTQVKIGQFMMTMTEVTAIGAAGHYKGKGEIPIAFLAGAKAKVRFDDILIDTEYLVHEGRVDVITEGLANWLDDQYQQFIDPYFVEGTIDSAYVQDSVAWVVVDGVAQSFNFDPPNYPIIVNDESGNQYTIYPNGTIVVSSYLSISETWAATADEVIHFTQSDSELRGFDPKEHMEWFENYEVMELGDSSKYFVANKSLAKDEADKVNVEIPSGATASFEFSDGTAVPSSSVQGSWIGATEHTGSSKMTLDIPARSSSGNYSIYALVNGQKVGQLNVKVYSQKDKELIVVPLVANSGISEIDIENELRKTLGEANIEVDVTLESPWIDSTGTFTASTNISMPSEVGLLSKYSDDMRGLRDAYFEQHPSAPKNKYYLFLVNGFDDPNELGYMVRGRSMGFVKASQPNILKTISHELGHGMGALEHTFKDDVIAKGSTNNLMDYSADPTNLTKAQWKELRDLDIAPSLFDEVEDYLFVSVDMNYLAPLKENGNYTFIAPDGNLITLPDNTMSVEFSTLDRAVSVSSGQETNSLFSIGSLIGFQLANNKIYGARTNGEFYTDSSGTEVLYLDSLTQKYNPTYAITCINDVVNNQIKNYYFPVSHSKAQFPSANQNWLIFDNFNISKDLSVFDYATNHAILSNSGKGIQSQSNVEIISNNSGAPISYTVEQGIIKTVKELSITDLIQGAIEGDATVRDILHYLLFVNAHGKIYDANSFCFQQLNNTELSMQLTRVNSMIARQGHINSSNMNEAAAAKQAASNFEQSTIKMILDQVIGMNLGIEINELETLILSSSSDAASIQNWVNINGDCALAGLSTIHRKTAFYKTIANDSHWELAYKLLTSVNDNDATYVTNFVNMVIDHSGTSWLEIAIPQLDENLEDDREDFDHLSNIFNAFTKLSLRQASNSRFAGTDYHYTLQNPLNPGISGQTTITYSAISQPILFAKDKSTKYYTNDDFPFSKTGVSFDASSDIYSISMVNGKVLVNQSYTIFDEGVGENATSASTPSTSVHLTIQYELNLYEMVSVQFLDNFALELGFDADQNVVVPAYYLVLFNESIINSNWHQDFREDMNGVAIVVGVAAFIANPLSVVGTLELLSAIAATTDIEVQANRALASNDELSAFNDWDQLYASFQLLTIGPSSVSALKALAKPGACSRMLVSFKGFTNKLQSLPSNAKASLIAARNMLMGISGNANLITRANGLGLTNISGKINGLASTQKTKFLDDFSQISDPMLIRMNQNDIVVDIWAGHTTTGQNLLASNVDVWLKHIEARTLQLNNQFSSIAQLFNENLVTPSSGYVASDMTSSQITSCNQIINSTTDIQSISTNTGIPANIITQVKEHFWVKTHLVRTDEGLKYGRFGKDDYDIQQWLDAQNGFQTTNIEDFKNLVAHEYVESKLMELGLHYRSLNAPYEYNPYNIGAHDMSPLLTNRQFLNAERLTSLSAVANDLGNLDQIIAELVQFYKL